MAGRASSDDVENGPLSIEVAASLLAAIVSSTSDAIVSKNINGVITSWNAATEDLFGYRAAEMLGRSIRLLIPEDRQAEEDAILAKIAAGERIENYETVRVRKGGGLVDVSVTISPVRGPSGAIIGASKIIRDISERKRSEARIAGLMAEVNHRARNLLALVQAIAHQTVACHGSDFLEAFDRRLKALAVSQDLLIASEWRGAALADVVAALARTRDVRDRVVASGPPVTLSAAAVPNLSLAFDELLSNAQRFGALSVSGGRVAVTWTCDDENLLLEWIEHGASAEPGALTGGWGPKLLKTVVPASLEGTASLGFESEGFAWRLRAPVARALSDGRSP